MSHVPFRGPSPYRAPQAPSLLGHPAIVDTGFLSRSREGAETYSTLSTGRTLQLPLGRVQSAPATAPELAFGDQLVEETLGLAHKILLGLGLEL